MRYGTAGVICVAALMIVSAGCASHRPSASGLDAGVFGEGELENRYQAAAAITDVAVRDQSLADVGLRAAQAGDGKITLQCLNAMSPSPARDDAGYKCSVKLAEVGWMQQARTVAQTISDAPMRDRALSRIAQSGGQSAEPR